MAFESLTDKLQNVFKKLRSKGRLTESDVKTALKEVSHIRSIAGASGLQEIVDLTDTILEEL